MVTTPVSRERRTSVLSQRFHPQRDQEMVRDGEGRRKSPAIKGRAVRDINNGSDPIVGSDAIVLPDRCLCPTSLQSDPPSERNPFLCTQFQYRLLCDIASGRCSVRARCWRVSSSRSRRDAPAVISSTSRSAIGVEEISARSSGADTPPPSRPTFPSVILGSTSSRLSGAPPRRRDTHVASQCSQTRDFIGIPACYVVRLTVLTAEFGVFADDHVRFAAWWAAC